MTKLIATVPICAPVDSNFRESISKVHAHETCNFDMSAERVCIECYGIFVLAFVV